MTIEQQRISISKWMGWIDVHSANLEQPHADMIYAYVGNIKSGDLIGWKDNERGEPIPNYPLDLNACHEMEKKIIKEHLWYKYCDNIHFHYPELGPHGFMHATSQQRSESLCRTLWPERFQ